MEIPRGKAIQAKSIFAIRYEAETDAAKVVSKSKSFIKMKKFLFVALGAIFALAMYAAEPADVGKAPQSTQVMLTQAEAQPMVVDFMYADFSVNVIATAAETSYVIYQAMPAEVSELKFKMEMPVFRLRMNYRIAKSVGIPSNRLARNSLPPNYAYGAMIYV